MKNLANIFRNSVALAAIAVGLLLSVPGFSADDSKKGYWIVENNEVEGKVSTMVRFYNTKDELIHEELVQGKNIHINHRNIKRLNKVLESYINNRFVELALK